MPTPPDHATPEAAPPAGRVLARGGVVLHPTETVYGLAADPRRPEGLARIQALKGRDAGKPFLALTDSWSRAEGLVLDAAPALARLMAHEPPLAVTVLLPAGPLAPPALVGPGGLVGLRRTPDPFCRALVEALGSPVLSTSANPAGAPAPSRWADVDPALAGAVDLALQALASLGGVPSTVVSADPEGRVVVLREGAVPSAEVLRIAEG